MHGSVWCSSISYIDHSHHGLHGSLSVVLQELAWESEKKRLAVAKLRKYFLDDLEVEHIVLHSFRYCSLAIVCFVGNYSTVALLLFALWASMAHQVPRCLRLYVQQVAMKSCLRELDISSLRPTTMV